MGKGYFLAGEDSGILDVVSHENGERRTARNTQREVDLHLGRNVGIRDGQSASVTIFML